MTTTASTFTEIAAELEAIRTDLTSRAGFSGVHVSSNIAPDAHTPNLTLTWTHEESEFSLAITSEYQEPVYRVYVNNILLITQGFADLERFRAEYPSIVDAAISGALGVFRDMRTHLEGLGMAPSLCMFDQEINLSWWSGNRLMSLTYWVDDHEAVISTHFAGKTLFWHEFSSLVEVAELCPDIMTRMVADSHEAWQQSQAAHQK